MHRIIDLYSYHFILEIRLSSHHTSSLNTGMSKQEQSKYIMWADNGSGSGQRADSALSRWQKEA